MARRLRIGNGPVGVNVDNGLQDAIERVIRTSFRETHDGLEAEAREVFEHAHKEWPVKSGTSKAALRYGVRFVPPNKIKASVYVDPTSKAAGYVYYIKGNKQGGKSTWVTLVRAPARKRARDLSKRLGLRFRYSVGQKGRMRG